ncbi:hypothetical protein MUB24_12850 [Lederbergia sp. NSJ-179]|uniref:hypothetical protein n=1 Tax=Lederbergia sp. NSJ-179 TaxID=2931402 RepID=UPI001FD14E3C|nr:hypothetical protein [Lederbergia sp. NSJ-179]MCJ7841771.1 hypothetical protein [Lederbergia sp. NSJ-179]
MYAKDTVRLCVEFKDFDGNPINPENVKLTIYDTNQAVIEKITDGIVDNETGQYFYDYIAADSDFIFEFSGFYFDKPVLSRQLVQVKFN